METTLQHINIHQFKTQDGKVLNIPLSFQLFGKELHSAPIILVNHALTGNSDVAGENGWWKKMVGKQKVIDTEKYTVICFNVPGNGFDNYFVEPYKDFRAYDIAKIFLEGLKVLNIKVLFALIGGSVGGAIGWEMLAQEPAIAKHFIPIATDFKTTDWLYSQCLVQEFLLESEEQPLQKARTHAMLCYRTPESLNLRFNRELSETGFWKSREWLDYHGNSLNERYSLKAYRLMNHLLMTIDADISKLSKDTASIHLISVDTDLFFPAFEIKKTFQILVNRCNVSYHEIKSIHGHDAFLMEYEQLNDILNPIFNSKKSSIKDDK